LAIYTGIINGSGPLTLESNNGTGDRWSFGNTASDYSGNTILSGSGTVVIQADSMGSATTADLTAGAFGTGTVSLNGAGMRSTTGAAKTIGNAITIDADTSFPTLASEKSLTFSGPVTLTGNRTLTANIGATVTTQTLAFSGAIGQNVAGRTLTHAGSGKIHLSGDNSYSGGTYLTGSGVLSIAHSNALGSGSLLLQSTQTSTPTTLAISGGITVTNPITMDSTTGRESISSTGTGNNALNGGITITGAGSNHLAISNNQTSGSLTISGGINGATYAGNVSLRGSLAGPNGFINGAVTIASEFQQNGTTDWVVNCPGSTWTNTRLMGAGGIILGADDALATSAKVLWTAGTGAVDLAGFNQTVAGLDAAAVTGAKVTNTGAADKKLTLNGLAADYTYAGTINDGSTNKVSLEMNSTGRTQTLTGANLYTGATTITGGTLALASTGSIDSSTALTIAAGAELDTTAKTTSQALPATVVIGLNGTAATSGLIDATGKALDVDGATVTFNVSGTLTAPSYVLANYGSISGTAAFASVTPPGGYTVNYGTGSNSTITLDKIAGSAYETWGAAYSLGAGTEGLDLDNDGMSNFEEFAFGLIPNSGSSVNPITSQLSKTSGQFTYQRLATSGLTYTIWTSSDLVTWTPDATANQNVTSGTPNDSVLVTLSALPKPLTATKTFVRVKAE
jgi:autotransporter-associated beta strand protein